MTYRDTTSSSFFEAKYQSSADPWSFATSQYEQARYQAIFDAIGHRRYRHVFEPGCSIGILTEKLASICDRIDASDLSYTAICRARDRTHHLSNVQTTCGGLPAFIPDGTFDLVVFSEIGYYFTAPELFSIAEILVNRIYKSGMFLAAHWLGESPDHLLSGDCVHEVIARVPNLTLQYSERHTNFRLDTWQRT
jgi:SAM-dependent methyltransferase